MKKTLAALSVLGAFAGSALAADVTLYGVIDTGLVFQHADADMQGVDTVDTFQMKSGVTAGSRFGLKGTEDLGNGLKIGFVLENGFSSDTGSFTQDNRLFGREAQLNLSGAFGHRCLRPDGQSCERQRHLWPPRQHVALRDLLGPVCGQREHRDERF